MGAPCFKLHFCVGKGFILTKGGVVGNCLTSPGNYRHFLSVGRASADGGVNRAVGTFKMPRYYCVIYSFYTVVL